MWEDVSNSEQTFLKSVDQEDWRALSIAMHHKRHRPRNARAGCKMCKPWKVNGFSTAAYDGEKFSDHRRRLVALEMQT